MEYDGVYHVSHDRFSRQSVIRFGITGMELWIWPGNIDFIRRARVAGSMISARIPTKCLYSDLSPPSILQGSQTLVGS